MTPFNYQNVPPPMSSLQVKTDQCIQQVAFHPDVSTPRMMVLTTEKVAFFDLPRTGHGDAKQLGTLSLP